MKTKTTSRCAKAALAVLFCISCGVAYAAETNTWTGAGADNKWSTKENWSPETTVPLNVLFPPGMDCTVEISGTPYYGVIYLPEGSGKVTLTGGGTLQAGAAAANNIRIEAGRELNVDGITLNMVDCYNNGCIDGILRVTSGTLNAGNDRIFGGNANVIVEGGTFGSSVQLTNSATLTVLGGLAKFTTAKFFGPNAPGESGARVRVFGGTFHNANSYAYALRLFEGALFENHGGTLLWGTGNDNSYNRLIDSDDKLTYGFPYYLPCVGGTLNIPMSSDYSGLHFVYNGSYSVGGTIYVTNNTGVAKGNIRLQAASVSLRGGATIYANALRISEDANSAYDLELSRLNLGIGGIRWTASSTNRKQALNFLDGIVFGAWGGDVPAETKEKLTVNLEGPVEYDTRDCFEPTVSRTINMARARLDNVTDLKAAGGGTVLLSADTGVETFRAIEVGAGTTLELTNAVAYLKAMNLKLGAGATIRLDLSAGGCLDAAASAEFGEGSKIVVTALPATLAAGTPYPVYFAPAGTNPDLSRIEYADGEWPAGWSLAKTGNAVYLSDGAELPSHEERDSSSDVYAILNTGDFPVVVSDSLETEGSFLFLSGGQGSIALAVGSSLGVPLGFGGDIRLGGSWTSQSLRVVPKRSSTKAVRRSRLTVMPGASLTVTGQSGDFNGEGAGALAVAANASATIGGTELVLASNNTHYVDGALTVNCPVVPQGRQVFRGSGTLTLAGGVSAASGGIRVEGGLTLVPADLVNDVALSVKGEVTIAPSANWTFGGDASIELEGHSTLTLTTGGHKVTLGNPVVSEGTLAVAGAGSLEIAAVGTILGKVTCADGAKLLMADGIAESDGFVDVLSVRIDDESVSFDPGFLVRKRFDIETGRTVYSAKRRKGMFITIR